jgi:hypothetical protein
MHNGANGRLDNVNLDGFDIDIHGNSPLRSVSYFATFYASVTERAVTERTRTRAAEGAGC